jgi:hypothetical protein
MSSKGEMIRKSSLRCCILAIIILCASVWWPSAAALAQEAALVPLKISAPSTLWSLEDPGLHTSPHLVIGMADRKGTLLDGSLRLVRDDAANPYAENTIPRPVGLTASVNRAEKAGPGPLVSSLSKPGAEGVGGLMDFDAQGTIRRRGLRISPNQAGATAYNLLDNGPARGSFLYQSKQWSTDRGSFAHGVQGAAFTLSQLNVVAWVFLEARTRTAIPR